MVCLGVGRLAGKSDTGVTGLADRHWHDVTSFRVIAWLHSLCIVNLLCSQVVRPSAHAEIENAYGKLDKGNTERDKRLVHKANH